MWISPKLIYTDEKQNKTKQQQKQNKTKQNKTKLTLFVYLSVCLLMHSAVLRRIEPKLARVVGARCSRVWSTFRSDPIKGQRSSTGQSFLKCPPVTKFGRKNPWSECNTLLWTKVMHGSAGVNQRSNCLGMPYGHQIWFEEALCRA